MIENEIFVRNLLQDEEKLRADIKEEFDKFDKATDDVLNIENEINGFMDKLVEELSLPLTPPDDIINAIA